MSVNQTNQDAAPKPVGRPIALSMVSAFAVLSASCCVIPIALTVVGLGGAWLSVLGPFVVYRVPILLVATLALGVLLGLDIRRRFNEKSTGKPVGLMVVSALVLLAWTAPQWEYELSGWLLDLWRASR